MSSRRTPRTRTILVVGLGVIATILVAPPALGGTGVGAVFNLGQSNSVSKTSSLTGTPAGPSLTITNKGPSTALVLNTRLTAPPMAVTSSVRVKNLNADRLDGIDSSGFLPSTGEIAVSADISSWLVTNSAAPISTDRSDVAMTSFTRSSAGFNYVRIGAALPVTLVGRELAVTGVDLCYQASATAVLSDVSLYRTTGSSARGTTTLVLSDPTDRNDGACRRYTPAAPVALAGNDLVNLRLGVTWTAASAFDAGRVSFILAPTGRIR